MAAFARLAVDPDVAAHEFGQFFADHQPEAGAPVFACGRVVGLGEGLEQPGLLFAADTDAVVLDQEVQQHGELATVL